ncbi:MAG: type IV pilus assembly protein PilM [Fimbriimonadaceae bacterium]
MRLSFRKESFVGLDLGHHTIKAAQVERFGGQWKVTRFGTIATPPDSIRDGVVVDVEAAGEAIKQLLRETHITASTANIAVSGGTVVVRVVRIPKMPEATLRKSIKYEASRYVPSSVEDSYIEFEIVGEAGEGQMDVLIVASPKELVESRIRACKHAGLHVEVVDVEAFAAYRSLIEADPDEPWATKTIAVVDIGDSGTNMSVVKSGVFSMTRTIPQGGHMFTEALRSYFKLSDEDAEQGKSQLDVTELIMDGPPKENPPLRVIQPHLDDLIREIRRSLNYYQSQQTDGSKEKGVSYVLLSGGGAKMHGLADYVGHKLALETRSAGVFDSPIFVNAANDNEHGVDIAVASGLAMRSAGLAA